MSVLLLILLILCRLPIKTLLRFRCLSKTCCSCIDSPDFLHLNRSIKISTNRRLIIDEIKPKGLIFAVDLDSSDGCPLELHPPHKPFVDTVESVYDCFTGKRILRSNKFSPDAFGSCNGLLAMYNGGGMSLWNPSTKKHQILPKFWSHDEYNRRDKILVGFGYDSINNDYKVIMMFQRKGMSLHYIKNH
ncbi:F-box protein CPR1-like [Hevea brasiliensis]|uniref:F-box protein CPR1-like n=1 Tax=Hevea brasiliensis TaxID=3981 RepID=UPI0025DF90B2|nr:F-box protein CPR1-like [Hevea brasiliensis]